MTHVVKHLDKLKRCITISFPPKDVLKAVQTHLSMLNKKVRLHGFRPGKVPMRIMQQKYGAESEVKAVQDLATQSFFNIVKENEIRLASEPVLDWPKDTKSSSTPEEAQSEQSAENTEHYEVDILFEVFPDIQFGSLSEGVFTRRTTVIGDEEVDRALNVARHKRGHYHERGSESEHGDGGGQLEAQIGDKVTIELINEWENPSEDHPITPTSADDAAQTEEAPKEQVTPRPQTRTLILGLDEVSQDLENAIIGMKKSDRKTFDLTLPDDYADPKWAGQSVKQTVTLIKVEWAHLPELNEEFLKSENFESLESLREAQKKALEAEAQKRTKALLHHEVMEYLLGSVQFDVPDAMIREEQYAQFESLFRRMIPDASKLSSKDIRRQNLPADFMLDAASRRARLGLILSELIRQNALSTTPAQIEAQFDIFANEHTLPVDEVRTFFNKTPHQLNMLKTHIAEQNAIDFILGQSQVNEESVSFQALAQLSKNLRD